MGGASESSPDKTSTSDARASASRSAVLIATVVLGLLELFALVVVLPKFEAIFDGLLRGFPRPSITAFLLDFRWAFVALAGFWMLAAIRIAQSRAHVGWGCGVLGAISGQSACTLVALFLPLTVTIQSLS